MPFILFICYLPYMHNNYYLIRVEDSFNNGPSLLSSFYKDTKVVFATDWRNGQPETAWPPPLIQPDLFWGNVLMTFQRFNTVNEDTSTTGDMAHSSALQIRSICSVHGVQSATKTTSRSTSPTRTFINTGMCFITKQILDWLA